MIPLELAMCCSEITKIMI